MRAPDSTAPWTACADRRADRRGRPAKATSAPGGVATQIAVGAVPSPAMVVERAHARVGQRLGLGLGRCLHGGDECGVAQRAADDHEDVDGPDARQGARASARRGERLADADGGHGARRPPVAAHAGAHDRRREHPDDVGRVQSVGPHDLGQVRRRVGARVVVRDLEIEPVPRAGQAAAEAPRWTGSGARRAGREERVVGPLEPHGRGSSK
jgi:hypothetical protein